MAAYQKGDVDAFAELATRHEKRLWNFLRRFVRDKATAEDLLQEVFLRVVKSAADWQPSAKVSNLALHHRAQFVYGPGSAGGVSPGRIAGPTQRRRE